MGELSNQCKQHLEDALANEDPREKDFHIRQVIQAAGMDDDADERRQC
ncbi:hypothetical protein Halru_0160 [Halovivax ruber XH-70]|uniref:Uncharacterized protein n=2 Tax=Halovivax TaxID=332951 RepID=L0IA65_HALRX|nr:MULTISPECIES: hypothetical protein [Halovivax]AGB14812.1 hypothetical protein Halru_0160 [Halovivax ruber XH-70]ELZ10115.1 hypothetical protein C479_09970 [Halovivax asiaticus JCM 14624]